MMFKVGIGPEGEAAYLRPETCQSIFVDFPRLYSKPCEENFHWELHK